MRRMLGLREMLVLQVGWNSFVDIVTCYRLGDLGIGSWWLRFSALIQISPGAHAATCTMGMGSLSQG